MAGLTLSEQARAELEETFRSTQDRRPAERCHAVLMAARGRKPRDISVDVAAGVRTVFYESGRRKRRPTSVQARTRLQQASRV
ncbi:hypothetical protein [Pyxidicoccus sp. MSG2]|uniref:hypothetical protein n=1 Tax=Pyxidicoccus sp. MSG2 TaxID=2996790 RepID=UPI002270B608|nr:hypothetical protein [Pyxidicoccus sp. MSG2]MCY1019668.1 hypothetical protein [Pyxidicoccus sp. MSG2]